MNYPQEFDRVARAKIVAAEIEAAREMYGSWSHAKSNTLIAGTHFRIGTGRVFQYIMTVVRAFSNEACNLGRIGIWEVDRIDREVKEFLRLTVIDAWAKYHGRPDLHVPGMTQSGDITRPVMEELETYPEWQHYLSELLEVAKAHAQEKTRSGVNIVRGAAQLLGIIPDKVPASVSPTVAPKIQEGAAESKAEIPAKKERQQLEPRPELLKDQEFVGRQTAAKALGISERTLDRRVGDGTLTPVGEGHYIRFKTQDILRVLNRKKSRQSRH